MGLDARDPHENVDRGALELADLVADELRFLGGDLPGLGDSPLLQNLARFADRVIASG